MTPRAVQLPGAGTIELVAPARSRPRAPAFRLVVLRTRDPRDLCVAAALVEEHLGEAVEMCEVRALRRASVSAIQRGVPDRLGRAPTVVAGIAPPGVQRVVLHRSGGGRSVLALSAHRAFLALVRPGFRGRIWVISESTSGRVSTRRFALPVSARPTHARRRPGAVFNDESLLEDVLLKRPLSAVARRFGQPVVVRREAGRRCAYYAVVGRSSGWRLCLDARGRIEHANANARLPPKAARPTPGRRARCS